MSKIGIMADCSSGVEYAPFENKVRIARTTINFGSEELIDGIDITADQFYARLSSSEMVPTTAAPKMGEIVKRVEEFKKDGFSDVIFFTISYGLSTYGANLVQIKDDLFEGINVHIFNSNTACLMEGYNAHYAEILASKGYSVEKIIKECEKFRDNTKAFFVVDDLKYLVKNGRLPSAAGLIGSLVSIKPILKLGEEGKIITFEKVRTSAKAINRLKELIIDSCKDNKKVLYLVLHTGQEEYAEELAEQLREVAKNAVRVETTTITPTVGAHIGNKILGMARIVLDDLAEDI